MDRHACVERRKGRKGCMCGFGCVWVNKCVWVSFFTAAQSGFLFVYQWSDLDKSASHGAPYFFHAILFTLFTPPLRRSLMLPPLVVCFLVNHFMPIHPGLVGKGLTTINTQRELVLVFTSLHSLQRKHKATTSEANKRAWKRTKKNKNEYESWEESQWRAGRECKEEKNKLSLSANRRESPHSARTQLKCITRQKGTLPFPSPPSFSPDRWLMGPIVDGKKRENRETGLYYNNNSIEQTEQIKKRGPITPLYSTPGPPPLALTMCLSLLVYTIADNNRKMS